MQWIRCKERLPEARGKYLVFCQCPRLTRFSTMTALFEPSSRDWHQIGFDWFKLVTHWMPLPTRPAERD